MTTALTRALATAVAVSATLVFSACAAQPAPPAGATETTTVQTNNGPVEIPTSPKRIAVLDNTAMETVRDLGVTPVALPKPLLPRTGFEAWVSDAEIVDVGNHAEPKLELLNEAQPDLIIGGYRFTDYYADLTKIAPTIDIAPTDEGGWVDGLKTQTTTLGSILGKPAEAAALVDKLTAGIDAAAAATNGEKVFLAVVSGGKVDNGGGRIGRVIEPLQLTDVFAATDADGTSVHNDSGLAPETIAQANPDWAIVLDRDAIAGEGDVKPAQEVLAAQEALAKTTFMSKGQVIYLDASFYVREGIQAYTQAYEQIAAAFAA